MKRRPNPSLHERYQGRSSLGREGEGPRGGGVHVSGVWNLNPSLSFFPSLFFFSPFLFVDIQGICDDTRLHTRNRPLFIKS